MLFQAYMGGRPAEFLHVSKGKACQDLREAEEANKNERPRKRGDEDDCLQYASFLCSWTFSGVCDIPEFELLIVRLKLWAEVVDAE
jgi:hypothetical protein